MTVANQRNRAVTLPEGASLRRVAQVLLDAWEVGSHQWTDSPMNLREAPGEKPALPVPLDAMNLFRRLAEQRVPYLLVGGLAMLTYVEGRNTKDVELLMSVEASREIQELEIRDGQDFFARGQFRSVQVDLLFTFNPVFKIVAEKFATRHRFAELEIPTATVEGLMILKLYALPSLYRQFDWSRIYLYESDLKLLLALHKPNVEPLFQLLQPHLLPADLTELRKMVAAEQERIAKAESGAGR